MVQALGEPPPFVVGKAQDFNDLSWEANEGFQRGESLCEFAATEWTTVGERVRRSCDFRNGQGGSGMTSLTALYT